MTAGPGWRRCRARRLLGTVLVGAAALAAPMPAAGQEAQGIAVAAALVPDTVRVGEPVSLGISVRSSSEPAFPTVLPLPQDLEQLGPPRVGGTEDGAWRAVYRLAAWRTGTFALRPVAVEVSPGGLIVRVAPPDLEVASVLPGEATGLSLRPPRSPAVRFGVPWGLILALLLLAAVLAWLLRRRRRPAEALEPAAPSLDPAEEARAAVAELRDAAAAGAIGAAEFYDGIETALRRYLARVRGRPAERPLRGLAGDPGEARAAEPVDPPLAPVVARALPARFGALAIRRAALADDADAVLAWLDAETAGAAETAA